MCTTELGRVAELYDEFKKRGIKMIALSCDPVEDHLGWTEVIISFSFMYRAILNHMHFLRNLLKRNVFRVGY